MYEKITTSRTKRDKFLPHDTLDSKIFFPEHDIMVVMPSKYVWGLNL